MGFNSTIKQKYGACPLCNNDQEQALTGGLCYNHYWQSRRLKSVEKQSLKLFEDEDLSGLIHDCDALFSRWIRLSHSDLYLRTQCYTCPTILNWKMIQCGHYVKRGNMLLRFDERNARPQCKPCNEYKKGNYIVFTRNLEIENPGITDILIAESRIIYQPSREELRNLIIDLTKKLSKYKI